jgi:uncharacterized membrane protein YphA (DoxX/SURF4 family)
MHTSIEALETPRTALRYAFGLVPLLAGLDKFSNLLTDWTQYVAPVAQSLLPFPPETFMRAVGIVEIAVGLLILTRWTVIGSYAAAAWLTLIAANLVAAGFYDIAVRDIVLALAAFTLARMTTVLDAIAVNEVDGQGERLAALTAERAR